MPLAVLVVLVAPLEVAEAEVVVLLTAITLALAVQAEMVYAVSTLGKE